MFLDDVLIDVTGGQGGDGIVHFRREKYVPRGGPDGGDGGRGGHVVLRVSSGSHGLNWYRQKKRFRGEPGKNGGPSKRSGRAGRDLILPVPPGTIVRDRARNDVLGDLTAVGDELVVARGGKGGKGNARFASSRRQTPRLAERGEPGEQLELRLELRLIADIGIVGVPNAGKSTLLAALTRARPKTGDYPFTTLQPNLGVISLDDGRDLTLADIPGLIEGAHRGAGLGDAFLRHIRRTRALIHLLDGRSPDPIADLDRVDRELLAYDSSLAEKPRVVALNKMDDPQVAARWPALRSDLTARGLAPLAVSAQDGTDLDRLVRAAAEAADHAPSAATVDEIPVHRPAADPGMFEIAREADGSWRVRGKSIERAAAMTYWEHDEAVRRFQRSLSRMGVEDALRQAGVKPGDSVHIGDYELAWED